MMIQTRLIETIKSKKRITQPKRKFTDEQLNKIYKKKKEIS